MGLVVKRWFDLNFDSAGAASNKELLLFEEVWYFSYQKHVFYNMNLTLCSKFHLKLECICNSRSVWSNMWETFELHGCLHSLHNLSLSQLWSHHCALRSSMQLYFCRFCMLQMNNTIIDLTTTTTTKLTTSTVNDSSMASWGVLNVWPWNFY